MVQLSVLFLLTFLKDFSLKPFTQGLFHAISHPYMPLQLCTQKALIMAVNTVMVKLITFLIVSLFICYPFPFFDVTIPGYNAEFTKPWLQYDVLVVAVRSAAAASGA